MRDFDFQTVCRILSGFHDDNCRAIWFDKLEIHLAQFGDDSVLQQSHQLSERKNVLLGPWVDLERTQIGRIVDIIELVDAV